METGRLKKVLDRIPGKRVMILGDFVADEFIFGRTSRISREAPVLILKFAEREFILGGAGNAARNLAALNAEVVPVGVVGDDEAGRGILSELGKAGMDTAFMFSEKGASTATKTRIMAGSHHTSRQQIVRVDRGEFRPLSRGVENNILGLLEKQVPEVDALIISDYHYGVISPRIIKKINQLGKQGGTVVTVDSRFRLLSFKNVTAVTPNEPEVEEALGVSLDDGDSGVRAAGERILKKVQAAAVLVTRGSRGMALFQRGGKTELLPIVGTDEVADVTGAGDTVIAIFTLALAAGGNFLDAARLANIAGGIVVMKRGTAVVETGELQGALRSL